MHGSWKFVLDRLPSQGGPQPAQQWVHIACRWNPEVGPHEVVTHETNGGIRSIVSGAVVRMVSSTIASK